MEAASLTFRQNGQPCKAWRKLIHVGIIILTSTCMEYVRFYAYHTLQSVPGCLLQSQASQHVTCPSCANDNGRAFQAIALHTSNSYNSIGCFGLFHVGESFPLTKAALPNRRRACAPAVATCRVTTHSTTACGHVFHRGRLLHLEDQGSMSVNKTQARSRYTSQYAVNKHCSSWGQYNLTTFLSFSAIALRIDMLTIKVDCFSPMHKWSRTASHLDLFPSCYFVSASASWPQGVSAGSLGPFCRDFRSPGLQARQAWIDLFDVSQRNCVLTLTKIDLRFWFDYFKLLQDCLDDIQSKKWRACQPCESEARAECFVS